MMLILAILQRSCSYLFPFGVLLTLAGIALNRSRIAAQRQKAQDEHPAGINASERVALYRRVALAATERQRIDSELFRG